MKLHTRLWSWSQDGDLVVAELCEAVKIKRRTGQRLLEKRSAPHLVEKVDELVAAASAGRPCRDSLVPHAAGCGGLAAAWRRFARTSSQDSSLAVFGFSEARRQPDGTMNRGVGGLWMMARARAKWTAVAHIDLALSNRISNLLLTTSGHQCGLRSRRSSGGSLAWAERRTDGASVRGRYGAACELRTDREILPKIQLGRGPNVPSM